MYLLYQAHLVLILHFLLCFLWLPLSFLNSKFDFLAQLLRKLYALILIVGCLKCLADLSVLILLEDLFDLFHGHAWVLLKEECGGLTLEISNFLINLVEFSTYQLLLVVDAFANEENLLLQRSGLILRKLTRGLLGENLFGKVFCLVNLLIKEG